MNTLYFPRLFALLFLLGCLLVCGGSKPAAGYPAGNDLRFKMRHLEWEMPGCKKEESLCARMRVDYPEAEGGKEQARRLINDTLESHLWNPLARLAFEDPMPGLQPDTIAQRFFDLYVDYAARVGDYAQHWNAKTSAEVIYQSPRIVTVSIQNDSDLGGAHPNAYQELLNFDIRRFRVLKLSDLISDEERLARLTEARFREFYGIAQDADLNEEGFFWGKPFYLPDNFGIEEKGLYLYYNEYEAASYVAGPTDILIPWEELKGALRKSFKR